MRAGVSMLGSCAATRFGVRRIPARARKLPQRTVYGACTADLEELNKERRGGGGGLARTRVIQCVARDAREARHWAA